MYHIIFYYCLIFICTSAGLEVGSTPVGPFLWVFVLCGVARCLLVSRLEYLQPLRSHMPRSRPGVGYHCTPQQTRGVPLYPIAAPQFLRSTVAVPRSSPAAYYWAEPALPIISAYNNNFVGSNLVFQTLVNILLRLSSRCKQHIPIYIVLIMMYLNVLLSESIMYISRNACVTLPVTV